MRGLGHLLVHFPVLVKDHHCSTLLVGRDATNKPVTVSIDIRTLIYFLISHSTTMQDASKIDEVYVFQAADAMLITGLNDYLMTKQLY